jgi:GT2 family glycosyltransferase
MPGKREAISVSVIVVSHNEGDYLGRTVESLLRSLPADGEIIVVDDGSTDGSSDGLRDGYDGVSVLRPARRLGAAAARNFGARQASGNVVLFSDAHVEVPRVWARPLLKTLERPGVGAVGAALTSMRYPQAKGYGLRFTDAGLNVEWLDLKSAKSYPVPLLGGFFLAFRRELFERIGGFDCGMGIWGMEDLEISIRLWTLGHKCLLVPGVDVAHLDRETGAYPAYQCDWETGVHNILRLAFVHFCARRLRRVVRYYSDDEVFPAALARLSASDAWRRRAQIRSLRRFDDTWYFRRFNMEL